MTVALLSESTIRFERASPICEEAAHGEGEDGLGDGSCGGARHPGARGCRVCRNTTSAPSDPPSRDATAVHERFRRARLVAAQARLISLGASRSVGASLSGG